jgi:sugar (pentulose or hexulose) kinase
MRVVTLDCGTSGVRAARYDCSGAVPVKTAAAQRPLCILRGDDGSAEQDPEEFYQAARATLLEVLRAGPCDRIVFGAQMHGLLRVDRRGTPRSHFSLWSDTRASAVCRSLSESEQRAFRARSGCLLSPGLPYFRLLAQRAAAIGGSDDRLLSHKSYFFMRACGWFCEDRALAAATGLYALRSGDWDAEALARVGVSRANLPRIVDCETELGPASAGEFHAPGSVDAVRDEALLAAAGDAIWIAGGADGGMAHLGAAGLEPGAASLSIGTSAAARYAAPEPPDYAAPHFCYPLSRDLHLVGLASNNGGEALLAAGARFHAHPAEAGAQLLADGRAPRDWFVSPYVFPERDLSCVAPAAAGFYTAGGAPLEIADLEAGAALAALTEAVVFAAYALLEGAAPAARSVALSGSLALAPGPARLLAALASGPVYAGKTGGPLEGALYFAGPAGRRALATLQDERDRVAPPGDAAALREKYATWKARFALRPLNGR